MKEKQMRKFKTQKGITLIALVVTIVVLLILAGVSISMLVGENGIINQAKTAKEKTEIADEKERVQLAALAASGKDEYGIVTREKLKAELDVNIGVEGKDYSLEGNGPFKVTYLETQRSYYVDSNGNINTDGENGEDEYVPTNPDYFTYILDEETKTATLTGIKDEYMLAGYYQWADKHYPIAIVDGDEKITDIKIPNKVNNNGIEYTVTCIGFQAFFSYNIGDEKSEFTSFCIPNTIEYIESNAFFGCIKLKEILIPSSVKTIEEFTFVGCDNLETIKIDNKEGMIQGEPWGAEENTEIIYLKNSE